MLQRVIVMSVIVGSCLGIAAAQVPDALLGGRSALLKDSPVEGRDRAKVVFSRDPGLFSLDDPTCDSSPMGAFVRFSTSEQTNPEINLPCENWKLSGSGFRYRDRDGLHGGVRRAVYKFGRLVVTARGELPPLTAPVTFTEVRFDVGDQHHCGRFTTFRKNDASITRAIKPSEACVVVCGDAIPEGSEECDDGNGTDGDGCDSTCTITGCGNGFPTGAEECDDGNDVNGDGCDNNCTVTACGNGVVTAGEDCDDGNGTDGDGCDNNCTVTACGNGVVTAGEDCDDGNTISGDGCRSDCTNEICGDGIVDTNEDCDDGGTEDGDCCSATCLFESGPCSDGDNCTENDVCQGGVCVGGLIKPWINEIDYDNNSGGTVDREEFVEIAGPAGLDVGGYTLYGVEGADGNCQTPGSGLLSGPVLPGYVHWSVTIPPGTVLEDDTGTGIGFLVVCNTPSSQTVIDDGKCDIIFPGIASDSNFKNGQLLNEPNICPDGMLLLDPMGGFTDAVSYEGIVPNAGPLGAFFHIDPPYNAGADEGWKPKTSLEKWTSSLGKAMDGTEWRDSGGCTNQCVFGGLNYNCDWITGLDPCLGFSATPGDLNEGQRYFCSELFCGDGLVTGDEECDEGVANNSDDPDASCRTDCTLRRCGDGIVDPTAAPGFPETCEKDADCAPGEVCSACQCTTGTPLGDLTFTVVPGSAANEPVDDGEGTWLRINQPQPPLLPITTGSNGQWTEGPLRFTAGGRDGDDKARFYLTEKVLISSPLPALAGGGKVCVRVRPDHERVGFIDCNGGSNVDVEISIDSNGSAAAGPPLLSVGANPGDSGAGAAIAYIVIEAAATGDDVTPCEDATYDEPIRTAVTTGVARSEILNGLGVGNVAISLSGQPFDCSNWTADAGASIAWPTFKFDMSVPVLGIQDVAQVLRLNDD